MVSFSILQRSKHQRSSKHVIKARPLKSESRFHGPPLQPLLEQLEAEEVTQSLHTVGTCPGKSGKLTYMMILMYMSKKMSRVKAAKPCQEKNAIKWIKLSKPCVLHAPSDHVVDDSFSASSKKQCNCKFNVFSVTKKWSWFPSNYRNCEPFIAKYEHHHYHNIITYYYNIKK